MLALPIRLFSFLQELTLLSIQILFRNEINVHQRSTYWQDVVVDEVRFTFPYQIEAFNNTLPLSQNI